MLLYEIKFKCKIMLRKMFSDRKLCTYLKVEIHLLLKMHHVKHSKKNNYANSFKP